MLAGPGSGKTRVITRRIANLVRQGVSSRNILAITFTNKAADEMAKRVAGLLPDQRIWISTFHRFCARLLRQHAESVGLKSNYSIADASDQKQIVRQVVSDLDLDPVHFAPAKISARISRAKNNLISAEDFARLHTESVGDFWQAAVAQVYPKYQQRLLHSNSVDFDDLLLHIALLLAENSELRTGLDERYRFVLVDEYQDTNRAQYQIVAALSQRHRNLCVTGDPDQSIYGWRGAQIENILRFEADFPNAKIIRLEQNFRSTKRILKAADSLIANNRKRKAKSLVTDNSDGREVQLLAIRDGRREADVVVRQIRATAESSGRAWSDFAIFYRVNSLSREFETALSRYRIPFQVVAGMVFYERAEIKDLLAYLRLIHNPADDAAFLRIVNKPLRGLGKTSQNRLRNWAESNRINLLEAASKADEVPQLTKRASKALVSFANLLSQFALANSGSVEGLLETVVEKSRYAAALEGSQSEQDIARLANVNELLTAARQYDLMFPDDRTLEGFLESTTLASDVDSLDPDAGKVTLMTLHAAKGLEFPIVYVIAVEQNLIPHERALRDDDLDQLEEERRLLFVGMTRAQEELSLTLTMKRAVRGRMDYTIPSPFLSEMNLQYVDCSDQELESTEWDSVDIGPEVESTRTRYRKSKGSSIPLTTGSALLNGNLEPATVPQGFSVGMTVRHPVYGLGTVVAISGMAKRRSLTVEFENGNRSQTFVASKCPLQPVGIR